MKYNLIIGNPYGLWNILDVNEKQLDKIVTAYKLGTPKVAISGKTYTFKEINEIQVFTYTAKVSGQEFKKYAIKIGETKRRLVGGGHLLERPFLLQYGTDVTNEFIGDVGFGELKNETKENSNQNQIIDLERINQLKELRSIDFDFKRLIKLCQEINSNYSNCNYLSVAILGRAIIDHVPPIFKCEKFNEVANNYNGGQSFKKSMKHLNASLRFIADSYLHEHIRKKETLPTSTQINFSQDLDVLLAEIIRVSA